MNTPKVFLDFSTLPKECRGIWLFPPMPYVPFYEKLTKILPDFLKAGCVFHKTKQELTFPSGAKVLFHRENPENDYIHLSGYEFQRIYHTGAVPDRILCQCRSSNPLIKPLAIDISP